MVNKVNELDDLTAKTSTEIKDTDARAQQGIQGVPFFIFDNRFALSGAQPEEVFDMAFK